MPLLALGSPLAARREPPEPSQCRADEAVVYSCRFGASVGSLCGSQGRLSYRFGPPGRPAIDIASDARWSNVHTGTIVGGGGGYQHHVRFSRGTYDYVVFEAQGGRYTEVYGKRWSGIHVARGEHAVTTLQCRGRAQIASGTLDDLGRWMPREVVDRVDDTDKRFDLWF